MENAETRIIEINGIKMEVDLRNVKVIENYKVGDSIKVLVKKYSDNYESHIGTIIGFDNFEKHPTVVIAYLNITYNEAKIEFLYFNSETKDVEITSLNNWDIPIKKIDVIKRMDKEIDTKEKEMNDIIAKKNVFEKMFGKYFEQELVKVETNG